MLTDFPDISIPCVYIHTERERERFKRYIVYIFCYFPLRAVVKRTRRKGMSGFGCANLALSRRDFHFWLDTVYPSNYWLIFSFSFLLLSFLTIPFTVYLTLSLLKSLYFRVQHIALMQRFYQGRIRVEVDARRGRNNLWYATTPPCAIFSHH